MSRRLPPLNAIRAFEAAARYTSFTQAAEELCVTPSAISRHVSVLESWLNVKLFVRTRRGIKLTLKGKKYVLSLNNALDEIERSTKQLQENADENMLRLKLPPTFAIRWLVLRLAAFHALNKSLDVQITTSHQPVDFDREDIDICIHSGTSPPSYDNYRRLFGEILVPVCSPKLFKEDHPLCEPSELVNHVLLCSMNRPADWPMWLKAAKITGIDGNEGLKFENSALAYQAAANGLGVAMAQYAFVEEDLRSGALITPFSLQVPTNGAYYFVYNTSRPKTPSVALFEDWIAQQALSVSSP